MLSILQYKMLVSFYNLYQNHALLSLSFNCVLFVAKQDMVHGFMKLFTLLLIFRGEFAQCGFHITELEYWATLKFIYTLKLSALYDKSLGVRIECRHILCINVI